MHDWLQLAIGAVILAAVLWAVRQHGSANPESTGKLSRQVARIFAELREIKTGQKGMATRAELEALAGDLRELEARTASSAEVIALEGKLNRIEERLAGQGQIMAAKIDAVGASADRTEKLVSTMNAILMRKGLGE
ncbi:hypothetical protein ACPVPU_07350 [Sphingomonas sp. CJ99]